MKFRDGDLKLGMFLVVAFLMLAIGPLVTAQEELVTVRVDGRPVMQVGALDGVSPSARARAIERRVDRILDNARANGLAAVVSSPTNALERFITVSDSVVMKVTPSDAQEQLTTVDLLAEQWETALNEALQRGRERRLTVWARFRTEVQGSIETAFSRLLESGVRIVPRALAAALVIAFFWLIATLVRWAMRRIFCRIINDLTVENLLKQVAYYSVWTLGLILAADAFGLETETIVTGLGLTTLALGFALKDILSNFVSGILILALRPFELGDQIVVGETEGAVERIQLRATHVRTYDGRAVLVPNAEVFTSRITNNTESPVRRGAVKIPLGYNENLKDAQAAILRAIEGTSEALKDPPPSVRVRDLGPSDMVIEARFWTDSRRSDFVATGSLVREAITKEFKAAGIGLPTPDLRRLVWDGPGERPDGSRG